MQFKSSKSASGSCAVFFHPHCLFFCYVYGMLLWSLACCIRWRQFYSEMKYIVSLWCLVALAHLDSYSKICDPFFLLFPRMMGTNYIGAFFLTKLLLPLLKNSPVPSRIVNVTSFTHRNGECYQSFEHEAFVL